MLDADPLEALGFRNVLAQVPQRARLRNGGRNDRVGDQCRVESDRQRPFHDLPQCDFITAIREFDQYCPWTGLVDRRAGPRHVPQNQLERGTTDQFEAVQRIARRGLEVGQHFNRERR